MARNLCTARVFHYLAKLRGEGREEDGGGGGERVPEGRDRREWGTHCVEWKEKIERLYC